MIEELLKLNNISVLCFKMLFVLSKPMDKEEAMDILDISKSGVSRVFKKLIFLNLVKAQKVKNSNYYIYKKNNYSKIFKKSILNKTITSNEIKILLFLTTKDTVSQHDIALGIEICKPTILTSLKNLELNKLINVNRKEYVHKYEINENILY